MGFEKYALYFGVFLVVISAISTSNGFKALGEWSFFFGTAIAATSIFYGNFFRVISNLESEKKNIFRVVSSVIYIFIMYSLFSMISSVK